MARKFFTIILAAFLLASVLDIPAQAATSNGYVYEIVDYGNVKYAYLTGYTGTATTLTMPSTLGGYRVERVSNQVFRNNTKIQSVTIPGTYSSIEPYAFQGCTSLRTVVLNEGISKIESNAFDGCEWLTSVNIPDSVTSLRDNPFYNCKRLKSIDTSSSSHYSFENNALYTADGKKLISVMTGTAGVFSIPEGVESILSYAAAKCTGLTNVVIPDTVTYIGSDAFHYCSGLTSIEIPESVRTIGEYAFRSCTYAEELIIRGGVTTMGNYAFADCGFYNVRIMDGVTVLGNRMLMHSGNTRLETVSIPSSVTSFGAGVLPKKKECVTVDCGSAALEWLISLGYGPMGTSAAYGYEVVNHEWEEPAYTWNADNSQVVAARLCSRDNTHVISETADAVCTVVSPTETEGGSVVYTASFTTEDFEVQTRSSGIPALGDMDVLRLPEDLETIGVSAFENLACEAIIIPDSCISVGNNAFINCKKLLYVRVPAEAEIAQGAFNGCDNAVIDRISQ